MLGTPKAPAQAAVGRAVNQAKPAGPGNRCGNGRGGKGKRNYGRLAGSDEHSPGVAISGRESGHALQVCGRTEDSRIQVGQSLALQEIAARSVDGREVE